MYFVRSLKYRLMIKQSTYIAIVDNIDIHAKVLSRIDKDTPDKTAPTVACS